MVAKAMTPYDMFKRTEFMKCAKDPVYFIENYVKIQHPCHGMVNFKLYDYQKELIELYAFNDKVISKMPRQSGKTVCAIGVILWKAIFDANSMILVTSFNFESSCEMMKKIRIAFDELPDLFHIDILKYSGRSIDFSNGSTIISSKLTERAGHGCTLTMIYFDELAFVKPEIAEQALAALMPALMHYGGKCIITSTPMANDDMFMKVWNKAAQVDNDDVGNNGFKTYTIDWRDIPRTKSPQEFEIEMRAILGDEAWKREYECEVV